MCTSLVQVPHANVHIQSRWCCLAPGQSPPACRHWQPAGCGLRQRTPSCAALVPLGGPAVFERRRGVRRLNYCGASARKGQLQVARRLPAGVLGDPCWRATLSAGCCSVHLESIAAVRPGLRVIAYAQWNTLRVAQSWDSFHPAAAPPRLWPALAARSRPHRLNIALAKLPKQHRALLQMPRACRCRSPPLSTGRGPTPSPGRYDAARGSKHQTRRH